MAGAGASKGAGATDDVEVMSTDSSSLSSTDANYFFLQIPTYEVP